MLAGKDVAFIDGEFLQLPEDADEADNELLRQLKEHLQTELKEVFGKAAAVVKSHQDAFGEAKE